MSLTKEQKDALISNLYAPVFDYIAAVVGEDTEEEKKPSFLGRLFNRKTRSSGFGLAFDLSQAAHGRYAAKAKFEARVLAILDAYLEGRVQKEALPNTEPVIDDAALAERRAHFKSDALSMLAEFDWSSLKGEDYAAARKAWWYHDYLRDMCAADPETWAAYKKALAEAKLD